MESGQTLLTKCNDVEADGNQATKSHHEYTSSNLYLVFEEEIYLIKKYYFQ